MGAAIQGIIFHPDEGFDITFAEQEDINPRGTLVQQLMVPPGAVPQQAIEDVREALRDLLDLALVARFNDPAERLSRR